MERRRGRLGESLLVGLEPATGFDPQETWARENGRRFHESNVGLTYFRRSAGHKNGDVNNV